MNQTVKVRIEFKDGSNIDLDLFPDVAPLSVANFKALVDAKFYDGMCFHRIIPGFMIQGGGFTQSSRSGLKEVGGAKTIKGEFKSNGVTNNLSHEAGVISMARTNVKDSASSQFFICVDNAFFLDGEYAAFGKTSDAASLEKAISLSRVKTGTVGYYSDVPSVPVVINTIKII